MEDERNVVFYWHQCPLHPFVICCGHCCKLRQPSCLHVGCPYQYVGLTLPQQHCWFTNDRNYAGLCCFNLLEQEAGLYWTGTANEVWLVLGCFSLWPCECFESSQWKNKLPAIYLLSLETQEKGFCQKTLLLQRLHLSSLALPLSCVILVIILHSLWVSKSRGPYAVLCQADAADSSENHC